MPNELQNEILANMKLKQLGSIMAKDKAPKWRTDSPLLDTLLSTVEKVGGIGFDPLDPSGGHGIGAVLGPIATRASKKLVSSLAKHAPELLEKIKALPQQVNFDIHPNVNHPTAAGTHQGGPGMPSYISIDPNTARGRLPQGFINRNNIPEITNATGLTNVAAHLPAVVGHEAQHAINSQSMHRLGIDEYNKMIPPLADNLRGKAGYQVMADNWKSQPSMATDEGLAYARQHQIAGLYPESLEFGNQVFGPLNRLRPMIPNQGPNIEQRVARQSFSVPQDPIAAPPPIVQKQPSMIDKILNEPETDPTISSWHRVLENLKRGLTF